MKADATKAGVFQDGQEIAVTQILWAAGLFPLQMERPDRRQCSFCRSEKPRVFVGLLVQSARRIAVGKYPCGATSCFLAKSKRLPYKVRNTDLTSRRRIVPILSSIKTILASNGNGACAVSGCDVIFFVRCSPNTTRRIESTASQNCPCQLLPR